jgi:hypothetical protein
MTYQLVNLLSYVYADSAQLDWFLLYNQEVVSNIDFISDSSHFWGADRPMDRCLLSNLFLGPRLVWTRIRTQCKKWSFPYPLMLYECPCENFASPY